MTNDNIEKVSTAEMKLRHQLTNYDIIITEIIKKRDEFDQSPDGKRLKLLQVWPRKKSVRPPVPNDAPATILADAGAQQQKQRELE